MKVKLVVGPCQPGKCGVGDYALRLADALRQAGAVIDVVGDGDWRLRGVPSLLRNLKRPEREVLHIQYPTVGFGHKLGPQAFAMASPTVVTLHEASRSHWLRQLSLYPFSLRTKHVIFTSEFDRRLGLRWAPWIATRSSVIPIGSNIETGPPNRNRTSNEIIYFGLIRPRKGIEDVLDLARLLKTKSLPLKVRIVGNYGPEHARYAGGLREESNGLPVIWEQDLDGSSVAGRLAASSIAYLPFPDGASERSGSLKAALANGMAVVTTRGRDTPEGLGQIVWFSSTPAEAIAQIHELAFNRTLAEALGDRARTYATTFSWDTVASQHLDIYEKLSTRGPEE